MSLAVQCPKWLRRKGVLLVWSLLLLAVIAMINAVGIRLAADTMTWQAWLTAHNGYFLAWRLLLYAATARGWLWMRKRVLARESDAITRQRLLRAELAAVTALVVLETLSLAQHD
ncbi:hypothetical protein [Pseudomonas citronellolis]|uniref:hypothetical protein n=1 Tax=Pseudomonas citronellolis TaxID=53408 RepID=UPI0021C107D4|nr:hypothetical protein [Pseudomonas citronellolis]UXJ50150.1 hypothetical protein N5P21_19380 [Pseudomonas citronellolis]